MTTLDAARAPKGVRIYAVGDVHGRLDLLRRLHAAIAADLARRPTPRFRIIHLGDLVDRGPDSAGVIAHVMELCRDGDSVALCGNHDRYLAMFLDGHAAVAGVWLAHGGDATAASYGAPWAGHGARLEALRAALVAAVPTAHRAFLAAMPLWERWGDYLFVHAGVRPGRALARQRADDLLTIREPFLSSDADHGAVVVHGHTAGDAVVVRPNRVCVDTRAWRSGVLSCLVLEGGEKRLLGPSGSAPLPAVGGG